MKKQVYKTQASADFGMCFDEIPLTSMYSGVGSAERVNVANKLYMTSRQEECGKLTGLNIREQVETFKQLNAKAKAFCILQGNTPDDMLKFYRDSLSQLESNHMDGLGGLAVADTCMGNELLESVDLLTGWKMVYESEALAHRNHLHLLGIGSVSRMSPILALMKSGYIPEGTRVSFDSSSHSQAYIFGRFYNESGKMRQLDRTDTPNNREFFTQIYRFYENIFSRWISEKEYVDHFSTYAGSIGKTRQEAKSYNLRLIAGVNIYATCLWQYVNFMNAIDAQFNIMEKRRNPVNLLSQVKNLDDMKHWNKACRTYIPSNRILREDDRVTLDIFA